MKCKKCEEVIHYTNLTSHFAGDCPCYCQYCDVTAEREVISSQHKEECCKFPLSCPNNCRLDKIPRDAMENHKMECPLEMIQCNLCKAKISRYSKEKHNNENKIEYLQLSSDEKFNDVFSELQRISDSIDKSKQEVVQLVQTDISDSKNSSRNNDHNALLNQPLIISSKLIMAVLCIVTAILVVTFLSSFNITKLQHTPVIPNTELDEQNVTCKNSFEQNDTCKNTLAQLQSKLDEQNVTRKNSLAQLQSNITVYKNELQQAKLIQDLLAQSEHKELQTELNYLWSIAMKIFKSCKYLYDYMDTGILWNEIIALCNGMSSHGDQVVPVIIKMSNYSEKMKKKEQWYSSPFFAFEGGYKVQMRVDAAVYGDSKGIYDHVFVYLFIVKGPHDDRLIVEQSAYWPIKGTFTIELLNQLNDNDHRSSEVVFTCSVMGCNFKAAECYLTKGHLTPCETSCYQITSAIYRMIHFTLELLTRIPDMTIIITSILQNMFCHH